MSDPTTPEQRPPLPDPNGGCVCTWHTQDAGAGYTEVIPEYEPACPEHSTHLYDPRVGMWINDPRGALDRVRELTYASDDGTEYDHNGPAAVCGEPECPACWATAIRRALDGTS